MPISKKEYRLDKRYEDIKYKKQHADRQWERVFNEALNGKIDTEMLVIAMEICNIADEAFYSYKPLGNYANE